MSTLSEEHAQRAEQRLTSLMTRQRDRFENARSGEDLRRRRYRLVSWGVVADRIERYFSAAARCTRTPDRLWFEHLYVDRDDTRRTVQLFFGQHPVPTLGRPMEAEYGAALVVSQNALGGLIILFYPFETRMVRRTKSRVIWRMLDGPEQLSEGLLLRMIDEFLTYSRVSSLLFKSSRREALKVSRLERRSRLIEGSEGGMRLWDATIVTLVAGSLITAGIYLAWALNPALGFLEPYAGMAALFTGWIAFRVQVGREAIDRATAQEETKAEDEAHKKRLNNP